MKRVTSAPMFPYFSFLFDTRKVSHKYLTPMNFFEMYGLTNFVPKIPTFENRTTK